MCDSQKGIHNNALIQIYPRKSQLPCVTALGKGSSRPREGSLLSGGGSNPSKYAASEEWADMIDGFQKAALETRLGIPMLYGVDAVHGNNNVYGATIFPHNIGLGATSWNGRKMHSDHHFLTEILKHKLGFKGFLITDWEAVDRLSDPYGSNYRECILSAINAGIDMVEMRLSFVLTQPK
nr:lysosomal beta glucosidase [Ipomoea batatas]